MDGLTEPELRYYCDLFKICSESDNSGKITALQATKLFRSANLSNEILNKITSLVGVPQTALHLSRQQFYGCLKLIAAYQASIPLREEILTSSMILPLPRFSWKESPSPSNSASGGVEKNGFSREWREVKSPDLIELARDNLSNNELTNSDQPSTDSEVEHNDDPMLRTAERHQVANRSPEAWSTASESPTPTNSVADRFPRPWAKETLWQGLLCEEQRQLLGTEEESSDKHSSDEDQDVDLEYFYQITPTQREYYIKQFRSIQPDLNGLVSGQVARVFFEKSRIPVGELRNIWQMCDVTKDGALNLAEFVAAMHLVVLRRNNVPLPPVLPPALMPNTLQSTLQGGVPTNKSDPSNSNTGPEEADLLHLESDDNTDSKILNKPENKDYKRMPEPIKYNHHASTTVATVSSATASVSSTHSNSPSKLTNLKLVNNTVTTTSASKKTPPNISPPHLQQMASIDHISPPVAKNSKDWNTTNKEWTKFTESPTNNVSSPGPKPVNFDMQKTTQAIVSDPQILHPVPLRVTPVGAESADSSLVFTDVTVASSGMLIIRDESSPKQQNNQAPPQPAYLMHQRDSLTNNDLRAIQRPQHKKPLPSKGANAIPSIPPPPQREPSITSSSLVGSDPMTTSLDMSFNNNISTSNNSSSSNSITSNNNKKVVIEQQPLPPLPPPRPQHRHARSSSLDLNKLIKSNGNSSVATNVHNKKEQIQDQIKMPPPVVPPRITPPSANTSSTGSAATSSEANNGTTSFADFAHFPSDQVANTVAPNSDGNVTTILLEASGGAVGPAVAAQIPQPMPRTNLSNSFISQARSSAFEVYRRKPGAASNNRNSQSPPPPPPPLAASRSIDVPSSEYEKRVSAMGESLRQVRFKSMDQNPGDTLKHLKDQNSLLLRLCGDLSEELLHIQQKKEEIRLKIERQEQILNVAGHLHHTNV